QARRDGQPWGVGSITKSRMRVFPGVCQPDELCQKLTGLAIGNHHIDFTLNEKYGQHQGKLVSADITIHSILTYTLPEWSDAIAKECGFPDLASMRVSVRQQVEKQKLNEWEQKASHELLTNLIAAATFAPLPEPWLIAKANEKFDIHLRQFKGDEKAFLAAVKRTR